MNSPIVSEKSIPYNTHPIEVTQRQRVVSIAQSWIGTKYHHQAKIKGVGCDCLTLLAAVYTEARLIAEPKIPYYSADFMNHRGAETYLNGLLEYSREVSVPMPGDVALWKFGRCFSHAAIVVVWPEIIHAYVNIGCVRENAEKAQWLSHIGKSEPRPRKFFSYWKE